MNGNAQNTAEGSGRTFLDRDRIPGYVKLVEDSILKEVQERFEEAVRNDIDIVKDRKKYRNAYEMKSERSVGEGESDVVVPLSLSMVETETAATVTGILATPDFFTVEPRERTDRRQANAVSGALQYVCEKNQFRILGISIQRARHKDGHAIVKAPYDFKRTLKRTKKTDPATGQQSVSSKWVVERDWPSARVIDNDLFHVSDVTRQGFEGQDAVFEESLTDLKDIRLLAGSLYIEDNVAKIEEVAGQSLVMADLKEGGGAQGEIGKTKGLHGSKFRRVEVWTRFSLDAHVKDVPEEEKTALRDALIARWGIEGEPCEQCGGTGQVQTGQQPIPSAVVDTTGNIVVQMVPVLGNCPSCNGKAVTFEWMDLTRYWVIEYIDDGRGGAPQTLLRCEPNPYYDGHFPYLECAWIDKDGSFWGMGSVEAGYSMQVSANAKENQSIDYVTRCLCNMWGVDKGGFDVRAHKYDMDEVLKWRKDGLMFFTRDPRTVLFPLQPNANVNLGFLTSERASEMHGLATGASNLFKGAPMGGRQTATEIETLQGNTQGRILLDRIYLIDKLLTPLLYRFIDRMRQYWTEEVFVRLLGPDGLRIKQVVSPDDLTSDVDIRIDIFSGKERSAMARQLFTNALSIVATTPGAMNILWPEMDREILRQHEVPSPNRFVIDPLNAAASGDRDPNEENKLMIQYEQPVEVETTDDDQGHLRRHLYTLAQTATVFGVSPDFIAQALVTDGEVQIPAPNLQLLFDHSRCHHRSFVRKQLQAAQQAQIAMTSMPKGAGGGGGTRGMPGLLQDTQREKQAVPGGNGGKGR